MNLKKKYGPLPLWAWGAMGIAVLYLWYRYYEANSSSTASDSSEAEEEAAQGIDPATGVPYADEESAYESSLSPGTDTGTDTTDDGSGAYDLNDFLTTLSGLEAAGVNFNDNGTGIATTAPPAATSTGTTTPGTGGSPATNTTTGQKLSTGALLTAKAILAPFGTRTTKTGYVTVGTGGGNYQYVPTTLAPKGYTIFHSISSTKPTVVGAIGLGKGLWAVPASYYSHGDGN